MSVVSMTGFGRAEGVAGGTSVKVEVKTVNHRFLDLSLRLPSVYSSFEFELAKLVRNYFSRGRVEISFTRTDTSSQGVAVSFSDSAFKAAFAVVEEVLKGVGGDLPGIRIQAALNLLNKKEILDLSSGEPAAQNELGLLQETLKRALEDAKRMRENEGRELAIDIRARLERIEAMLSQFRPKTEEAVVSYRQRLNDRMQKLSSDISVDPNRLAQEVALMAERTDVSEEFTRLASHLKQFHLLMGELGSGKKLDFLVQEMFREINTIGSKSQHIELGHFAVEAKAELEKIREQVQNVE